MTTLWSASSSIFAPIFAAVPPGTSFAGFGNTLLAAAGTIPTCELVYNVRDPGKFRRTQAIFPRTIITWTGENAKPYATEASLADMRPGVSGVTLGRRLWTLGMYNLKQGTCTPAIPPDYEAALLLVSSVRASTIGVAGGPQLALLRHLWSEAIRAAHPEAIVFGGQTDWSDKWWPSPAVASDDDPGSVGSP